MQQNKLLKELIDGNTDAVLELVEFERADLFDFLFRMTGQKEPSLKVLDELVSTFEHQPHHDYENLQSFRIELYRTARSFCSHIWNADTSALCEDGENNTVLATTIGSIDGEKRELLLLKYRCGFSDLDVSQICGVSERCIDDFLFLVQASGEDIRGLSRLNPYMSVLSSSTAAVSQIMGDIDEVNKVGFWKRYGLLIIILLLAGSAAYYYRYLLP